MTGKEQIAAIRKEVSESAVHLKTPEALDEYKNRVYHFLNKLPRGKTYTVAKITASQNIALFTALVKLYICERSDEITFINNDFKRFRKCRLVDYEHNGSIVKLKQYG